MPNMAISVGTQLRLAVSVVVVVANILHGSGLSVLPWVLLVTAADLLTGVARTKGRFSSRERRSAELVLNLTGAALAGLALVAGPGALPLVIVPFFRLGERWGRRYVFACGPVYLTAAALAWFLEPSLRAVVDVSTILLWGSLALSLGVLTSWSTRLSGGVPKRPGAADEAALLLARLSGLATELRGGFDPATSAEHLLDAVGRPGPMARSGVLVGSSSSPPVPLALRGSERVPWPDPTQDDGVVGVAWRTGRAGSSYDESVHREVRVVPLRASNGVQIGVLVQDVMATTASADPEALDHLAETAQQFGPVLGVALAFAKLREHASFEERERLAREMHDGIAQELVVLSFQLEQVKRSAELGGDASLETLDRACAQLRLILGDLRSQISDLRVSVRSERGLGATMSSRLQSFGTATGLVVSLRLDESGFRLPARAEMALYQLFLDFLADVKHSGATGVDIDLTIGAPYASLRMRHDGSTVLTDTVLSDHAVTRLGGELTISDSTGLDLCAELFTPTSHASSLHLQQKVPQAS